MMPACTHALGGDMKKAERRGIPGEKDAVGSTQEQGAVAHLPDEVPTSMKISLHIPL